MRHHKSRRVHFPKRMDAMTSRNAGRTTSKSALREEEFDQPDVPTGFVIEEIDEEIEAQSGDISNEGDSNSTTWTTIPTSDASTPRPTSSRPKKNIFPITRNWKEETSNFPTPEMTFQTAAIKIPSLFTTLPPIRDLLQTQTSQIQDETVQTCLPFLSNPLHANSHGIPRLLREKHIRFLHKALQPLPAPYTPADASRPWFLYWALSGLSILGEDVSIYRERVIETVRSMQNPTGGFGGGFGQLSHLAPSYAVVLALGIVGCASGAGDEVLRETMSVVDRRGMWEWLGRVKCADGGFRMCEGGEEDARGAYCATVIITLLSLPLTIPPSSSLLSSQALPSSIKLLTDLLPDYISQCQTFEGGISARPDTEAHGGYAFCALACLSILFPPTEIVTRKLLDVPKLINWLSARQHSPESGFAGRTNKLVDGCYSHWVGGCWPLIEAALAPPPSPKTTLETQHQGQNPNKNQNEKENASEKGKQQRKAPGKGKGVLYSREGLIRYIMCCCQDTGKRGGLRDKPGKSSDAYHTCYVLAGLSSAMWQNHYSYNHYGLQTKMDLETKTETSTSTSSTQHPLTAMNNNNLTSPYAWTGTPYYSNNEIENPIESFSNLHIDDHGDKKREVGIDETQIFDDEDLVEWVHPVFVVPGGVAERVRGLFLGGRDEWV